jgi:hypothetical protein
MSAKLILDQDAINESDFEGSRILGITAPIKLSVLYFTQSIHGL